MKEPSTFGTNSNSLKNTPSQPQKKRGRPVGSKSNLDKRRGPNAKGSNSSPTRESTPSRGSELRVGGKRSSEKDEDEVCSPAKKPRCARVDSELDMDSVMGGFGGIQMTYWIPGKREVSCVNEEVSPIFNLFSMDVDWLTWDSEDIRYPFTWRNNQGGGDFIESRLDRALESHSRLLHYYNQSYIEHLDCIGSEHKALLLHTTVRIRRRGTPFRFDARLFKSEDVKGIVQSEWAQGIIGSPLFYLSRKIKKCQLALKSWRVKQNLNSRQKIEQTKEEMRILETQGREFHSVELAALQDC
ncbi:hypothetical protein RHMOL_Rhmol04G0288000 [Rhododendron molle]|uniref:Uncharacterized protein n=1 Tax=Rhododendron molle TaxID=49168 RepID=A0ACC0P5A4_RHOML|nr:hypothetical protein RHMOL_Rhmol04G0288000 [Rhododendron molle]